MSLLAVLSALQALNESVPNVRRVFSEIPSSLNAEELPALATAVGETTYDASGRVGVVRIRREFQTHAFIAPVTQIRQQTNAYDLYALVVDAIVATYLNQRDLYQDGTVIARIDLPIRVSEPQVATIAGTDYFSAVISFTLVSM